MLLMDDDDGDMHFRNLGSVKLFSMYVQLSNSRPIFPCRVYEAISEEEALNLLFLGNMNRVTSDTPMNQVRNCQSF